jgi:hypothetical protein
MLITRQVRRAKARRVVRRRLVAARVKRIHHGPLDAPPAASAPRTESTRDTEEKPMTLGTILLIVLVLMLVGAFPRWSHSRSWGYGPSSGLGLVLVVVVVLLLMGRI